MQLSNYALATIVLLCGPYSTKADLPNIVIIYADDMGFGDLAIQNPDSKIRTPHLDKLAREGMRFTDAHSSSGICTPSRYALLTGRYHWRKMHGIVGPWGKCLGLRSGHEKCLPWTLRRVFRYKINFENGTAHQSGGNAEAFRPMKSLLKQKHARQVYFYALKPLSFCLKL